MYRYGLNSLLGNDIKKNRDNDKHHALDAICISFSRDFKYDEESKKDIIKGFTREMVKKVIDEIMPVPYTNKKPFKGNTNAAYNTKILADTKGAVKLKLNKLSIQLKKAIIKGDTQKATQLEKEWSELYNKEVEKATHSESIALSIHKFWTNYANRLGIEYASNFSNFVKK